jgi:hypothetical protein
MFGFHREPGDLANSEVQSARCAVLVLAITSGSACKTSRWCNQHHALQRDQRRFSAAAHAPRPSTHDQQMYIREPLRLESRTAALLNCSILLSQQLADVHHRRQDDCGR